MAAAQGIQSVKSLITFIMWKGREKQMKTWALSLIGLLFIGTACNSYTPKEQADDQQLAGMTNPDFSMIQTKVLQPYCVMCHSAAGGNAGGVNLENYTNVI